jgi:hypothetical protein
VTEEERLDEERAEEVMLELLVLLTLAEGETDEDEMLE